MCSEEIRQDGVEKVHSIILLSKNYKSVCKGCNTKYLQTFSVCCGISFSYKNSGHSPFVFLGCIFQTIGKVTKETSEKLQGRDVSEGL